MKPTSKAIVIGVSAGGFKALHLLLPLFGKDIGIPIMVVQHRGTDDDAWLAASLNKKCSLKVKEAMDKEPVVPGTIYLAPSGYHLLVEKDFSLALSVDEPVCYSRPSIDVLFESAAEAYGLDLIGIVLTGANSDGSDGIIAIKAKGGYTIAQDPATAEVDYMPRAAIKTNAVDTVLALEKIPPFVEKLLEVTHGRD